MADQLRLDRDPHAWWTVARELARKQAERAGEQVATIGLDACRRAVAIVDTIRRHWRHVAPARRPSSTRRLRAVRRRSTRSSRGPPDSDEADLAPPRVPA